jgi:hypothetical protein
MTPHPRTLAATAAAVGLLLTGCTSDPAPTTSGTPSASATASASASPSASATSTLSAAQQQAVDEVTAVVLAREQMFYDLLADPEPYLNQINDVTAQPQLDIDLRNLQQIVVAGKTVIESTGPVSIASVKPIKVDLKGDPPTVTLLVCVDKTAASGTDDGKAWTGPREEAQYRVIKTTYLPDPGWALAKVLPPKGYDQPQPC